jgi:hypothetical protein
MMTRTWIKITGGKKMRFFTLLLLTVSINLTAEENTRISGTNRDYNVGDWITWSTTRYVRDLDMGNEFVYYATTGGVTRYNFYEKKWYFPWTISNGLSSMNIHVVGFDKNTGYLWCITGNSISYQEPATNYWSNIFFDELGLGYSDRITSLGFGDDNKIYLISSRSDWYRSDNTFIDFTLINKPGREDFIRWRGGKRRRLSKLPHLYMEPGFFFDERNRVIDDVDLRHYDITCWLQDEWQNLYLGTWGLGTGHANLVTYNLELRRHGLWSPAVDAIGAHYETLWIGGVQDERESAGITKWTPFDSQPEYFEPYLLTGFHNENITAIAADENLIWFGTLDGLTRHNLSKDIWRTYTVADNLVDNRIQDVVLDDTTVWVATVNGVSRIDKATVGTDSTRIQLVDYPALRNISVRDLDQHYNLLWMATEFGIYVYDKAEQSGGFYSGVEGPSGRECFAVSCFEDEVWFGGVEGVSAFNVKSETWLAPPAKHYEMSHQINRILAAEKAVWVATADGVYKFDRERERWVRFGIEDGLPTTKVFSLHLSGDYIWLGTLSGITRFYWNSPYRID